jgi:hypothetical protein
MATAEALLSSIAPRLADAHAALKGIRRKRSANATFLAMPHCNMARSGAHWG